MAKKWNFCLHCKRLKDCIAGQERSKGITEASSVYMDVGCFDEEQYKKQLEPKQLKFL